MTILTFSFLILAVCLQLTGYFPTCRPNKKYRNAVMIAAAVYTAVILCFPTHIRLAFAGALLIFVLSLLLLLKREKVI